MDEENDPRSDGVRRVIGDGEASFWGGRAGELHRKELGVIGARAH